jgi:hypothetical protein
MKEFLQDGRIIEVILALMVVEGLLLSAWYKLKGQGVAPINLVVNLLAGVFLLLAVLGVLQDASSWTLGTCLGAALLAHVADLALRWNDAAPVNRSLGEIVATRHRFFERSL